MFGLAKPRLPITPEHLSEEQYGYALARFAFERGEARPAWRKFLSTNVSAYWKRSAAWLADRNEPRLLS
jgi:hypothetical protein